MRSNYFINFRRQNLILVNLYCVLVCLEAKVVLRQEKAAKRPEKNFVRREDETALLLQIIN